MGGLRGLRRLLLLLLLIQPTLAVGLVLVDIGLSELNSGGGTSEHLEDRRLWWLELNVKSVGSQWNKSRKDCLELVDIAR